MIIFWIYIAVLSLVTFCVYGYDKRQAILHKRRVREAVLHGLALAGGTPGAFAGQLLFRHKTKKMKFRGIFFIIVVVQLVIVIGWMARTRL